MNGPVQTAQLVSLSLDASHLFSPPACGMEIRPWSTVSVLGMALGHPEGNSVAWTMPGRLFAKYLTSVCDLREESAG